MSADPHSAIRLFVSDVDGTLVTPDKTLTPATVAAVRRLRETGIGFTLVSSRPPRGMARLVERLEIDLPFAAFNGGNVVGPDMTLIEAKRLSEEAARDTIALFQVRGVEVWGFADDNWLVTNDAGAYIARERHTVGFDPVVVPDFEAVIDRLDKLVGVSEHPALLATVEGEAQRRLRGRANARRSQAYYLDVTNPEADKGHAVRALCRSVGVPTAQTAVIGDQANDIAMFKVAGLSIAMGQGTAEVKASAQFVTDPNTADGVARAVERFVLPRAGPGG
ncbi:MAG TPA: HAD family hydrolase [Caulobacteraceae bacterium]|nr:HAD family hydrolase [Caulobacteraceae bacterium]